MYKALPDDRYLVAHGLGDGTFALANTLTPPLGNYGRASNNVIVDDFNGDGFPDFAVRVWIATSDQADVEIWLNDPVGGTFNYVPDAATMFLMHSVDDTIGHERGSNLISGDFDGDGVSDIIAHGGPEYNNLSDPNDDIPEEFRFYKGKAVAPGQTIVDVTDLFEAPLIVNTQLQITNNFATADLDGDGNLDLVASTEGRYTTTGNPATQVMLGNGDGTFAEPVAYYAGGNDATIADINGDGVLDLAVSRIRSSRLLATLMGAVMARSTRPSHLP